MVWSPAARQRLTLLSRKPCLVLDGRKDILNVGFGYHAPDDHLIHHPVDLLNIEDDVKLAHILEVPIKRLNEDLLGTRQTRHWWVAARRQPKSGGELT